MFISGFDYVNEFYAFQKVVDFSLESHMYSEVDERFSDVKKICNKLRCLYSILNYASEYYLELDLRRKMYADMKSVGGLIYILETDAFYRICTGESIDTNDLLDYAFDWQPELGYILSQMDIFVKEFCDKLDNKFFDICYNSEDYCVKEYMDSRYGGLVYQL